MPKQKDITQNSGKEEEVNADRPVNSPEGQTSKQTNEPSTAATQSGPFSAIEDIADDNERTDEAFAAKDKDEGLVRPKTDR